MTKEPAALCHVIRGFFEETEPIHEFDEVFYPMPLGDDILKKIYKENVMVHYKNMAPREADYELMSRELDLEESMGVPSKLAADNLAIMRKEFLAK